MKFFCSSLSLIFSRKALKKKICDQREIFILCRIRKEEVKEELKGRITGNTHTWRESGAATDHRLHFPQCHAAHTQPITVETTLPMMPRVASGFTRDAVRRDASWDLQSRSDARFRHEGVTWAGGAGAPPARPCRRWGEPAGPAAAAPCPPATAALPLPASSAPRCPPPAEVTALGPPAFPHRARRGQAFRPAALRGAPAPQLPLSRYDSGGARRPFPLFSYF